MTAYRVLLLDATGHRMSVHELACDTDDVAMAYAASMLAACPGVEVWHLDRKVGRLDGGSILPPLLSSRPWWRAVPGTCPNASPDRGKEGGEEAAGCN